MKKQLCGQLAVGFLALVTILVVTALPSDAWTRGGGGFHSGGFHSGGFHHGGFHHGFHPFFGHRACCFGPRVFLGVGVGVPFLYGYPYAYDYGYPYPVYSPPAVVEAPPVYVQPNVQPEQQYWHYCRESQAYYPYVKECPGGWLQVLPQPSPPPR